MDRQINFKLLDIEQSVLERVCFIGLTTLAVKEGNSGEEGKRFKYIAGSLRLVMESGLDNFPFSYCKEIGELINCDGFAEQLSKTHGIDKSEVYVCKCLFERMSSIHYRTFTFSERDYKTAIKAVERSECSSKVIRYIEGKI
ncbi:hypothetical protein [Vibrio barjaei]|uniref:hypothetical protein n=1 Tax=Vibrio barjaei TaxID=1676683 RepID=UPI002284E1D3|nr:hypothetical protein [Vibrio barjaei]MCY9873849.1 hypothetical protein [Vibrio barjaei]